MWQMSRDSGVEKSELGPSVAVGQALVAVLCPPSGLAEVVTLRMCCLSGWLVAPSGRNWKAGGKRYRGV